MIKHPEDFLSEFIYAEGIERCEISVYEQNQTLEDKGEPVWIDGNEFLDYFKGVRMNLKEGQEIAFHSKVSKKINDLTEILHIPMINLAKKSFSQEDCQWVKRVLEKSTLSKGLLFSSGNAYHLYSPKLLYEYEWRYFMGVMLSEESKGRMVDPKWIGHQLKADYCSLRLTNNSGRYKKAPEFVRTIIVGEF